MSRQRLGQHFLEDLHWREEIACAIRVSPHSAVPLLNDGKHCWIEVGPGHGEVSQHLAAAGDPVHAIEIDPKLIGGLRHLAKQFRNLDVVQGDILSADLAAIAAGKRIRLYGNLPYYITSPILHHLFAFADLIDEIHIVIQHEVALRLAATPGTRDYGYLSVLTQFYSRPELVFEIPPDAFHPPPEVTSALVTLRLPGERAKLTLSVHHGKESHVAAVAQTVGKGEAESGKMSADTANESMRAGAVRSAESHFLDFVKLCFSQKRKTLVNNLRLITKPERVRKALASLDLRPDARAEQLTVAQFAALQSQLEASL
jgi:16S rRNA (adenine1518-N6/adenine1519-N6)-dimethyltransferase